MKYVTGIHALNLPCYLEDTTGDWHASALRWEKITFNESEGSPLGDYGIEYHEDIPEYAENIKCHYWANTIRACFDLLILGNFAVAQGMRNDYICTDRYDYEVFRVALKLKNLPNWDRIDKFLEREYMLKWIKFKNKEIILK